MNKKNIQIDVYIHKSAEVSENAVIGEGTKIWNNVQVRENAVIGRECVISKDVYIDHSVRIGSRVKIQNGVSVYHGVTVEDDVFLGPHCVLTNDMRPRAFNREWKVEETRIKEGASVGAGAVIVCGKTIGEFAMIGAGAVVTKSVPPHALVVGNPAKIIDYVCRCGKRLGLSTSSASNYKCGNC